MYDDVITADEVRRIHEIVDDSTRNNEITLGYHHLANALADFTRSTSNNWCAWATWTSKTIGVGIRWGEVRDLSRRRVDRRRDGVLDRWVAPRAAAYMMTGSAVRLMTWASHFTGRRLADGNRDVFCEIGTCVTALIDRFGGQDELDASALDDFVRALDPVSPAGSLGVVPMDRMREATRCFVLARYAPDPRERAELVLAGNIQFAAYEQARLQSVVEASVWAPVDWFFRPLAAVGRRLPRRIGAPGRWLRRWLRTAAVRLATRYVLVVVTEDEVIRLGRPLPPAPGASSPSPPPYDHPLTPELAAVCDELLGDVDLSRPLAGCWTDYDERVRFTAALFRSRHDHPTLRHRPMVDDEQAVVDEERGEASERGETWVAEAF